VRAGEGFLCIDGVCVCVCVFSARHVSLVQHLGIIFLMHEGSRFTHKRLLVVPCENLHECAGVCDYLGFRFACKEVVLT
jgi:hypothetical protein